MLIERNGIQSRKLMLDHSSSPTVVKSLAKHLENEIRRPCAFNAWVRHRSRMAAQRKLTAMVQQQMPGPYYPGPLPEHIAVRPWREAKYGDWALLPRAIVARLLRTQPAASGVARPPTERKN
jgi:hypothetical protein